MNFVREFVRGVGSTDKRKINHGVGKSLKGVKNFQKIFFHETHLKIVKYTKDHSSSFTRKRSFCAYARVNADQISDFLPRNIDHIRSRQVCRNQVIVLIRQIFLLHENVFSRLHHTFLKQNAYSGTLESDSLLGVQHSSELCLSCSQGVSREDQMVVGVLPTNK